jgi:hypothetical protein
MSLARKELEDHLSLYGEVGHVIVEKLFGQVLTTLLEDDLELFMKKVIWRRFLTLLELIWHGFSKHELVIYRVWWRELSTGRGNTETTEGGCGHHRGEILGQMGARGAWQTQR